MAGSFAWFFNDTLGKLQLVKKLLDKLENVLRSEMMNDNSHDKDYLMDTFLDTSLQEFTERGEVISLRLKGLTRNRKM